MTGLLGKRAILGYDAGRGTALFFVPIGARPARSGHKTRSLRNHNALDAEGTGEVHRARDPKLGRDVAAELDSLAVGAN